MVADDADRLYAEVETGDAPVTVPLAGTRIVVPPIQTWPGRALDALRGGDYETWAEQVLNDDSFDRWTAADPTVDECATLLDDWAAATGQDLAAVFRLAALIDEHPKPLEGDLWFHYRIDLRDLWRPAGGRTGLTWRLLDVLVDRLPGESATKTAVRDDLPDDELAAAAKRPRKGHGPWSHSDLLTADVIDLLKWLIFATYAAQGGKPKEPEPYPRPGVVRPMHRRIGAAQHAHLQRLRDEHARLHGYDIE